MSLTDKITMVNGDAPDKEYFLKLTAAERDYTARAILKMPQHIKITQEFEITVSLMRKLGYMNFARAIEDGHAGG